MADEQKPTPQPQPEQRKLTDFTRRDVRNSVANSRRW